MLDLNWLSAFFNVDGIEINARADIIFVTTGATDGRMIFFLNSVYFSANNAYCEQNLHRLTHIAKFLRKCVIKVEKIYTYCVSLCAPFYVECIAIG